MRKHLTRMVLAVACAGWSLAAQAQVAYAVKDVNLRAGPARDYPVVAIVPQGTGLEVHGCLSDYAWCDVMAGPYRGWVYAGNIDYAYQGGYVPLLSYGPQLGIAIIGFVLFDYWNRFYVNQPFFRDRAHWEHRAPYVPRRLPQRAPPAPPAGLLPPPGARPPARILPPRGPQPPARVQPPAYIQPPARVQPPAHIQPPGRVQPPAQWQQRPGHEQQPARLQQRHAPQQQPARPQGKETGERGRRGPDAQDRGGASR